ncbi:hypothetical protein GQR58_027935 [Nymphon striatum]|nr:hypothetical protein GQR58_027935 [Nymphon striatum]
MHFRVDMQSERPSKFIYYAYTNLGDESKYKLGHNSKDGRTSNYRESIKLDCSFHRASENFRYNQYPPILGVTSPSKGAKRSSSIRLQAKWGADFKTLQNLLFNIYKILNSAMDVKKNNLGDQPVYIPNLKQQILLPSSKSAIMDIEMEAIHRALQEIEKLQIMNA